ncbi:MAG TPA: phage holin family protein [Opitutaceae bacterium]|nr:phage holin family protein [Opitutaceae bacterium]
MRDTSGLFGSLRELGDGLLAGAQGRLELFSIELQEEKLRLLKTVVGVGAAVFLGMLAVVFTSLTVVFLFWETARLAVLGSLALFYAGALVVALLLLRRFFARQPSPFAATLHEFGKDRECIRNAN